MPFLKHAEKKKEAEEMLSGYFIKDSYKCIVKIVLDNPGITNQRIANLIKRKRCSTQLRDLVENQMLIRTREKVDESFKYFVTENGTNWLKE